MQTLFNKKLALLMQDGKDSLLLAVSGGVDSMCMARLAIQSGLCKKIAVAHMNFSLRGEESDGDEAFVKRFAEENNIPFFSKRVDTLAFARENAVSTEMAARELRYRWFEELSAQEGFDYIAVAHNANDSAETVFLNILRGTGIKGLTGIRSKSGRIIRPMLSFTRQEIESYAAENGIEFRTDSTNEDCTYQRNRIRNVIFPEFRKINPSFLATVTNETGYFSQVNDIVEELFKEKKPLFCTETEDVTIVDTAALLRENHASYWLFRILEPLGFNQAQISLVENCINSDAQSGKQFFSATHRAILDRKTLKIYPIGTDSERINYVLKVYRRPANLNPKDGSFLDARKLGLNEGEYILGEEGPVYQRIWKPADRFSPFGMKGFKKVSDFLTSLKLDLEQKDRQKVIAVRGEDGSEAIAFVAGRTDNRFRIDEDTDLVAEILTD
ncbi:MAG: tRNA lysidine(34) synthetase TilS [Bacteroidales bacterium]|nr:tRNA lysidine(34) synthetase TilS [Bacteroidales bacterium]